MKYIGYADESYITNNRFRSISFFSFNSEQKEMLNSVLYEILVISDVKELKWEKLKSAKYKFCALKVLDSIFDHIETASIRIDTIIWDTHDERHNVFNRDDIANDERMFYHLSHHALRNRPRNSCWFIYPDERNCIDWKTLSECIQKQGNHIREAEKSLWGRFLHDSHYQIEEFSPVQSHDHPETQVADLFAGLSVFAQEKGSLFKKWQASKTPSLFDEFLNEEFSNKDNIRFEILQHLLALVKQKNLPVSFLKPKGLRTWKPSSPLNFWQYQPQRKDDKAPVKVSLASITNYGKNHGN